MFQQYRIQKQLNRLAVEGWTWTRAEFFASTPIWRGRKDGVMLIAEFNKKGKLTKLTGHHYGTYENIMLRAVMSKDELAALQKKMVK